MSTVADPSLDALASCCAGCGLWLATRTAILLWSTPYAVDPAGTRLQLCNRCEDAVRSCCKYCERRLPCLSLGLEELPSGPSEIRAMPMSPEPGAGSWKYRDYRVSNHPDQDCLQRLRNQKFS